VARAYAIADAQLETRKKENEPATCE